VSKNASTGHGSRTGESDPALNVPRNAVWNSSNANSAKNAA
jgi:hypothetical protein